jgi:hypothetical protein
VTAISIIPRGREKSWVLIGLEIDLGVGFFQRSLLYDVLHPGIGWHRSGYVQSFLSIPRCDLTCAHA